MRFVAPRADRDRGGQPARGNAKKQNDLSSDLRLIFAAANHDEAHSGWQAASECCGHGTAVT